MVGPAQRQFLDCPFCGRHDLRVVFLSEEPLCIAVRCCTCQALGPQSVSLHGAVQWWNTREEEGTSWDS